MWLLIHLTVALCLLCFCTKDISYDVVLRGGTIYDGLSSFVVETLSNSYKIEVTTSSIWNLMIRWGMVFFTATGPMLLLLSVAGLAISFGQVGFVLNEEALTLKLQRLDPIAGAKRLLSKRSLVELVKGIFKILIVGYVSYITIKPELALISTLADVGVADTFGYIATMIIKVGVRTALVLLVLAALDYAYQRWEFNKSIRMTKQEVKEEQKQTEGDPQVRMRIRSLQREAARRRMMDEVPEADVVITNPTHYAVAVKYDMATMAAPAIVAKGQNLIAQKIKVQRAVQADRIQDASQSLRRSLYQVFVADADIAAAHALQALIQQVVIIPAKCSEISRPHQHVSLPTGDFRLQSSTLPRESHRPTIADQVYHMQMDI